MIAAWKWRPVGEKMIGLPKVTADGGWGSFFLCELGWNSQDHLDFISLNDAPKDNYHSKTAARLVSPCQKKERKGGKRKGTEGGGMMIRPTEQKRDRKIDLSQV